MLNAMPTKQINMRLDENLINSVTPILSSFGLNISDACRIFLNKVVMENGIPFVLKYKEDYIPNKETLKAMEEVENKKNLIELNNIESLWEQYDN